MLIRDIPKGLTEKHLTHCAPIISLDFWLHQRETEHRDSQRIPLNPSNTPDLMKTNPSASEPTIFLTPAELRTRWRVSGMFLWRLRRDGKLRCYRIGGRGIRYALVEILQLEKESAA